MGERPDYVFFLFLTAKNPKEREEGPEPVTKIKMNMEEDAVYDQAEQFFCEFSGTSNF